MDGTPPAYYFSAGIGPNQKNFVIYFEGGGWCGLGLNGDVLEDCLGRSKTDLGSSSNYKKIR